MPPKHVDGCYEACFDQGALDYSVKCGLPAEIAKGFLGKKMKYTFKQVNDKSVWYTFDMEGCPEWSMACLLSEGVEASLDMPGIGTAKVSVGPTSV